jgi:UDP-N-acetylglucosamine 1-carboxyvinyltransferase
MESLRIEGGRPLVGDVQVPGSKNTALAILSSVLLAEEPVVLRNVPDVSDVKTKLRLLAEFGCEVEWREQTLFIDPSGIHDYEPDEESVRQIRTSFYLLGPILARLGRAVLPMPGGCKIGARPVDYHLKGLSLMGAEIDQTGGRYVASAKRLVGAEIYLDFPSAGATQHLMAAATLAQGVTTIQNAAMEPEIGALAEFLNGMGARIEGAGTSMVTVTGVRKLGGTDFRIPEDRLQAGTFLLAGAITGGNVRVKGVWSEPLTALINKMREAEVEIEEGTDWIRATAKGRVRGTNVRTMPYPGFPTDLQQPFAAMLAIARGQSMVEETIYESRIGHVQELGRMGANVRIQGRTTIIEGVPKLRGAAVEATDLRAGAALVLAGLAAEGQTIVRNVHFIDRGYEDFEGRLALLGANIRRVESESSERGTAGPGVVAT